MGLHSRCSQARHFYWLVVAVICACVAAPSSLLAAEVFEAARLDLADAHFRRPVAAGLVGDHQLCVANGRSGSVSLVDIDNKVVIGEWRIGEQLSDIIVLCGQKRALATDEKRQELIALDLSDHDVRVLSRLKVSRYPISVRVDPEGKRATVAGLWSHRLDVVDLDGLAEPTPKLRRLQSIEIPFPPRCQLWLPENDRVLVADAFSGRLALIDPISGKLVADHAIDGHNIRGLATTADQQSAIIVYQRLFPQPITPETIEAGSLMKSLVGVIPLAEIAQPEGKLSLSPMQFAGAWNYENLSDPGGVAMLGPANLVVAFAGVDRIGVFDVAAAKGTTIKPHEQARAGRRPVAVVTDPKQRMLVVNNLSDSISIIDPQTERSTWQELALGPMPEPGPRERGELMFYGAKESFHWWASCHSCHTDGHTCGQLADTFGDGTYGAPKRVVSLLGTGLTDPWAWSGAERELRDQIHKSLETTSYNRLGYAKQPEATARRLEDLAAFLHSLPPPPPLDPPTDQPGDVQQIERGRRLFHDRGCARCHVPPLTYTSPEAFDVGLTDEQGQKKFNPPSLRGVSQGESFLHDGRAKRLSDVFIEFGHGLDTSLSDGELADLLRFLRSI